MATKKIDDHLSIELDKVLGKGPLSLVYKGMYGSMPVAVKQIEYKSRIDAERDLKESKQDRERKLMHIVEKDRHRNVIGYYYSTIDGSNMYLAMQLCNGDLTKYVEDECLMANYPPLEVNRDIAKAIAYLHENNIAHRDLKPENVFYVVRNDIIERIVVADFGFSKTTKQNMFSYTGTFGTMGYMPYEVWTSIKKDDGPNIRTFMTVKSDIFAMGCIFYFTVYRGRHPFGRAPHHQTNIGESIAPDINIMVRAQYNLRHLLLQMLNHQPKKRPTASDVLIHPALWSPHDILNFLRNSSDDLEYLTTIDRNKRQYLESADVISGDTWFQSLPRELMKYLDEYQISNGRYPYKERIDTVSGVLRIIRNITNHYLEFPVEVREELGRFPDGHVQLWMRTCPHLFMHVYKKMTELRKPPLVTAETGSELGQTMTGEQTDSRMDVNTDVNTDIGEINELRKPPVVTAEIESGLGHIMTSEQTDTLVDVNPDVNPDIGEINGKGTIDEKTLQIYFKALDDGEEQLKHIRLMVVGMFGVGKTSLVRRLQGESIEGVESTKGIDVNVKKCALDEDGTWINQESKDSRFDARLTDVVVKSETTAQVGQLKMDQSLQQAPKPKSPGPSSQQLEKSKNAFEDLRKTDEGKEYIEIVQAATSQKSCAGIKPTISIWDFAGQSVYYSTHHFFLSSRSIYLLVMDISKPLDSKVEEEPEVNSSLSFEGSMKKDYTCLERFKFWVSSIYTQYKVEKGKQYQPTIVLVGTHGDKLKGDPKEKELQKDNYFYKARKHFDAPSVGKLFHPRTFLVSCSDDADDVFNDLKANITEIAKNQPHWNNNTPAKWIPLERSIEYEKRKSKERMEFSEVAVADGKNEYNLNDESEIKQFLQVQHSFGNAIYFDAKDLDTTIILNPQWLINLFKQFVTHRPNIPNEMMPYWIVYQNTAKLHKKLLDYITKTDENGEKDNKVNEGSDAVRYMEHLDVIAKPVSEEDVDFHIVPCMLKQLMPVDYENKIKDLVNPEEGKSTYVLCFAFNDGYLPPSVFHRLLATYIKRKEIKRRGEELLVYNGFGAFKLTSTKTLCIWYADFIIFARVILHDKKNDILLTDDCINIRKELSDTITKILQLHQQNQAGSSDSNVAGRSDPFKEHVLCEKAFLNNELTVLQSTIKIDCMFGLYDVEKMEPFTDCDCSYSVGKGHVIKREMALRYWFEEPHYLKEISKWFEEPENGDLMQLSRLVNVSEFSELRSRLNIPSGSIQQIQRLGLHHQVQVRELLQQWYKEDNGHNNLKLKQILFKLKENMEDRPYNGNSG